MGFQPVKTERAYERIVAQVEGAIRSGELGVGDRLPSEREMVTTFEVSRSTVREALRVLQSNGVIRLRPGDPLGPEIIPLDADTLRAPLSRLVSTQGVTTLEMLQFRAVLEGATSHLAAAFRTPEQLVEMRDALADLQASIERGHEEWSRADMTFHETIARAAGNTLFVTCEDVVRTVASEVVAETVAKFPDAALQLQQWYEWHARLLDMIESGDPEGAGRQARVDIYEGYALILNEDDRRVLRMLVDPRGELTTDLDAPMNASRIAIRNVSSH